MGNAVASRPVWRRKINYTPKMASELIITQQLILNTLPRISFCAVFSTSGKEDWEHKGQAQEEGCCKREVPACPGKRFENTFPL
jgi:hypothetical protein